MHVAQEGLKQIAALGRIEADIKASQLFWSDDNSGAGQAGHPCRAQSTLAASLAHWPRHTGTHSSNGSVGLVALTFRSLNSFKRPFVRMPRGFFRLETSAAVVDYRTH